MQSNKFNINVYLNETCKDAINFSEFLENIEVSYQDLENNVQLGFVNGIAKIFTDNLKQLELHQRPIHCTDVKREIVYIKDNNVWEKDCEKEKVIKTIKDIAHKNFKRIPKWKEENPMSDDSSTKKHMEYMLILNQVMSGITPEDPDGIHKIVKKIATEVYIDK
jgi:hypothetical protein